MTRRTRGLALVILGAAVSACTAIAGLTDDYRLADGGGSAGEGGSGDGNVDKDGALPDGFVPGTEGGADAKLDQQVTDGGSFCDSVEKSGLQFCTDFDSDDGGAFSTVNDVSGTAALAPGAGTNGSMGYQFMMTYPSGGASKHFWLAKALAAGNPPSFYQHYEVQFDVRIASGTSTLYYVALGTLSFTSTADPEQDHGIAVNNGSGFGKVPTFSGAATDTNAPPHWHRVHLKLDRAGVGTPYTRTITVTESDGVTATTVDSSSNHIIGSVGDAEFRIGTFNTGGNGSIQAVFDNVFIRRY